MSNIFNEGTSDNPNISKKKSGKVKSNLKLKSY